MINELLRKDTVNINMDSDGILSYLFLKLGGFKGKVSGYSNSKDLILSVFGSVDDMFGDNYVDIFMPRSGTLTVDQHVISAEYARPGFGNEKINPHLMIEDRLANSGTYYEKFPFSTCMFILAMLEREGIITEKMGLMSEIGGSEHLDPSVINLADMVLRADGVLRNVVDYTQNVVAWSERLIKFSNNGVNTRTLLCRLLSGSMELNAMKFEQISKFYVDYGLTKDGGYSSRKPIGENIRLINLLMKSFANRLGVELEEHEVELNEYRGTKNVTVSNKFTLDLNTLDTYAFVGRDKLSYTVGFEKQGLHRVRVVS